MTVLPATAQPADEAACESWVFCWKLQEHVKDSRVSDIIQVYEQKLSTFAVSKGDKAGTSNSPSLPKRGSVRLLWCFPPGEGGPAAGPVGGQGQGSFPGRPSHRSVSPPAGSSGSRGNLHAQRLLLQQASISDAPPLFFFFSPHARAQACKLGSLLKEAERRGEHLQAELSSQVLEVQRSTADMEELLQHNSRLQRDSEEHQALKGTYNTLLTRSEVSSFCKSEKKRTTFFNFHFLVEVMLLKCFISKVGQVKDDALLSSSQVQRQRAPVEGPAGCSHLALQAERLSEEDP